ncbi:MAG: hypothetical protein MJZ99_02760 [Bacteroidales bacterium]|nr:hypothetical protein [Bacteroidales bacterium]
MRKNKLIFFLLYTSLFVCSLMYSGAAAFGPLSLRHVLSLLLLVFLISIGGNSLRLDKYFGIYLVFVAFWGLGAISSGHALQFANKLFGTTLAAFVMYQATKALNIKYQSSWFLIFLMVTIGILDSVVTIFQYYNHPLGFAIPRLLGIEFIDEFEEYSARRIDYGDTGLVLPGLLGGAHHGYFLLCAAIASLFPIKGKLSVVNMAIWAILMGGLLFVQERAPFYLGMVGSIFTIFSVVLNNNNRGNNKSYFNFFILLIAIVFIPWLVRISQSSDLRYSIQGSDLGGRLGFIDNAINFVINNPLGGYFDFAESGAMAPHNLFVNALIWGGVIGGSIISLLVIYQVLIVLRNILFRNRTVSFPALIFGVMFLLYTGNSFLHNESVVTGYCFPWIYWALFIDNIPLAKQFVK